MSSAFQQHMSEKAQAAIRYLEHGLVGRSQEVRLIFLAALAGHHSLMVGTPGTAKSMIARRLESVFDFSGEASASKRPWFQVLLMRFTKPDELFGPLDLQSLKGNSDTPSKYKRNTEHYLPEARFAFLDEIFKANSAILNALLTILNERKFYNDGEKSVDLISVVAASNELPRPGGGDSASDALTALYDRFLVRLWIDGVSSHDFETLLDVYCGHSHVKALSNLVIERDQGRDPDFADDSNIAFDKLHLDEVTHAREAALCQVSVPLPIRHVLHAIREDFREYANSVGESITKAQAEQDVSAIRPPFYVSDRRWKWIVEFLKVAAWYENREYVSVKDLSLLQFIVPCDKPDIPKVQELALRQDPILRADFLSTVDSRVAAVLETAASSHSATECNQCLAEVTSLDAVLAESYGVLSSSPLESLWVPPETMQDSVTAANPTASSLEEGVTKRFGGNKTQRHYKATRKAIEALQKRLIELRQIDEPEDEIDEIDVPDTPAFGDRLEFPDLGITFSLLRVPRIGGLGTEGWPGANPAHDVYVADAPILCGTWKAVMGEELGISQKGLERPADEFLRKFLQNLGTALKETQPLSGTTFQVRLMTVNEWRLALWYVAGRAPFESLKGNAELRQKVCCADGARIGYPRHETLKQCNSPELYTVLGMRPQICTEESGLKSVGGAAHLKLEDCLESAASPRPLNSRRNELLRVVIDMNNVR